MYSGYNSILSYFLVIFLLLITACGGGSGSSDIIPSTDLVEDDPVEEYCSNPTRTNYSYDDALTIGGTTYRSPGIYLCAGIKDYYKVELNSSSQITFFTEESIGLAGNIYDSNQSQLNMDNYTEVNGDFRIEITLSPGTYYLVIMGRTNSEEGKYYLNYESNEIEQSDDVSNTDPQEIVLTTAGTGSYTETILDGNDRDLFFIDITTTGEYTFSTTGNINTFGALYRSSGTSIASDTPTSGNFQITYNITETGRYHIRVGGSEAGSYTLLISRTIDDGSSASDGTNNYSGDHGVDPGPSGNHLTWTLTWSYSGSERAEGPDIDLWVLHPDGIIVSEGYTRHETLILEMDDQGGFGPGNGGGAERIYNMNNAFFPSDTGTFEYGVRWRDGASGNINIVLRVYDDGTLIQTHAVTASVPDTVPGPWWYAGEIDVTEDDIDR